MQLTTTTENGLDEASSVGLSDGFLDEPLDPGRLLEEQVNLVLRHRSGIGVHSLIIPFRMFNEDYIVVTEVPCQGTGGFSVTDRVLA